MAETNGKLVVRLIGDDLVCPFAVDVPGGHQFTGTVRPATTLELERYRRDLRAAEADPERFHATRVGFYAAHLKSWGLVDPAGTPVPVSETSIRGLPESLLNGLGDVVFNQSGMQLLGG